MMGLIPNDEQGSLLRHGLTSWPQKHSLAYTLNMKSNLDTLPLGLLNDLRLRTDNIGDILSPHPFPPRIVMFQHNDHDNEILNDAVIFSEWNDSKTWEQPATHRSWAFQGRPSWFVSSISSMSNPISSLIQVGLEIGCESYWMNFESLPLKLDFVLFSLAQVRGQDFLV